MQVRDGLLRTILTLTLLVAPVASSGQQPDKVYRIGWLATGNSSTPPQGCPREGSRFWQTWVRAMQERGYVQGRNVLIECRYTQGRNERAAALATELVSLQVDLIVAGSTNQVRAAMNATRTIPIVMHSVIDPFGRGLVSNFARPESNVTGVGHYAGPELPQRYLALLMEAVPRISRLAILQIQGALDVPDLGWLSILETEARRRGVTPQLYLLRDPAELEDAFAAMTAARAEALLVVPSPPFYAHAQRIVDLAALGRLPAIYQDKVYVERGGLMAYQADELDDARHVARYVDRILKGATPSELPVEQPSRFRLILNLKTAKTLGLTIPPALLNRADEVVQ